MNAEDLIALNEEIAGMARAGLPLDQGLAALAREMGRGRLRSVTEGIADDLRAGHTLPQALERQGNRVPPYYASLVAAGVRSGRIGEVLATLTVYARTFANLRMTIVDALFYPTVVILFALALFVFACFFILPQFDQIFRDFQMRLPLVTEWTLALGRNPRDRIFFPLVSAFILFLVTRWVLRCTENGRRLWARFLYSLPVLGTLVRSARLAAFTDLLALLVDQEVPLPEAFRLAGDASSDPLLAANAREIEQGLSQGQPLGEVLKGRGLVPEWVAWMTGLGERRGTLGTTLHQIAAMYRQQVETRAALLRSVLPPFLVLATAALFVALFVLALMLPMMRLLEGLSK